MTIYRTILMLFALSIIAGCTSAPKVSNKNFLSDYEKLSSHKEKSHYSDRRFVDKASIDSAQSLSLDTTVYRDVILPEGIKENQIAIIANSIDREICVGFSSYFQIVDEGQSADLNVRSNLMAIRPTGKGMATLSAIAGNVAPFWIRPPAGMGALAAEAELLDSNKQQRAAIVWARGARSMTESESISSIGDAYQLAEIFANDFIKLTIGKRKKMKDAKALKDVNLEKCSARYGKNKVLASAASFLLPMSPESMDKGRPMNKTSLDNSTNETPEKTSADDASIAPPSEPAEAPIEPAKKDEMKN